MKLAFSPHDLNSVEHLWDQGVPFMSARQTQPCLLTCNKCWKSVTRLVTRRWGVGLLWLCLVLLTVVNYTKHLVFKSQSPNPLNITQESMADKTFRHWVTKCGLHLDTQFIPQIYVLYKCGTINKLIRIGKYLPKTNIFAFTHFYFKFKR